MTTRHHRVRDAIKRVLSLYHLASVPENQRLHPHLRPDLHVLSLRKQVIIDVTIVDDVHGNTPNILDLAAETKHTTYDGLAEATDMLFFAVPMSPYGLLHAETKKFIDHLARHINQYRRADFKVDMRTAIQCALLEGNSKSLDSTVARLSDQLGCWVE